MENNTRGGVRGEVKDIKRNFTVLEESLLGHRHVGGDHGVMSHNRGDERVR